MKTFFVEILDGGSRSETKVQAYSKQDVIDKLVAEGFKNFKVTEI